jgi:hypothetical protein
MIPHIALIPSGTSDVYRHLRSLSIADFEKAQEVQGVLETIDLVEQGLPVAIEALELLNLVVCSALRIQIRVAWTPESEDTE